MSVSLETRKFSIIEQLVGIQDEVIILQIENLVQNDTGDWWDDLTEAQQASIHRGVQQLDEGKSVDYQEFISKYKTKEE